MGEGWLKVKVKMGYAQIFVMDIYTIVGLASLLIQISILAMLIYGYYLKRKLRFRRHGLVMAYAAILHLGFVLGIMIPSFALVVVPHYIVATPLMLASMVGLIHGITGTATVVLAVWLVYAWRFRKDFSGCFSRKKAMLPTLSLWLVTLMLGIALFVIFYGPSLMS